MHLSRAFVLMIGLSGPVSADSLADMRQNLAESFARNTKFAARNGNDQGGWVY